MGLELLPAELQLEVFSYLDNISLKAARAVSRKLRNNASPALFRSVVACARYHALGAFQNISNDPVLQKYVAEIVFDGSTYDAGLANHEHVYVRKLGEYVDLQTARFWSKHEGWKRYRELYIEQEDLKASGVLLQTIARAFKSTTNVASIVYSPHSHLIPVEAKVVRDLIPRGVDEMPLYLHHASNSQKEHPFRQFVGALYESQYSGIRELRVEPLRNEEPGTPFTLASFNFPDPISFQAARHLFQNLERCELSIKCWNRGGDTGGTEKIANLSKMLVGANKLQHLALHIDDWLRNDEVFLATGTNATPMLSLLGLQNTWSKLQSLSLGGLYAKGEQLLDLIRRHKSTLTSIAFRNCRLEEGTWADIVDEIVYSSDILPFVLDLVQERIVRAASGTVQNTAEMEEWSYEGHVEVSKDGERYFVDTNSAKKSVYHQRST